MTFRKTLLAAVFVSGALLVSQPAFAVKTNNPVSVGQMVGSLLQLADQIKTLQSYYQTATKQLNAIGDGVKKVISADAAQKRLGQLTTAAKKESSPKLKEAGVNKEDPKAATEVIETKIIAPAEPTTVEITKMMALREELAKDTAASTFQEALAVQANAQTFPQEVVEPLRQKAAAAQDLRTIHLVKAEILLNILTEVSAGNQMIAERNKLEASSVIKSIPAPTEKKDQAGTTG